MISMAWIRPPGSIVGVLQWCVIRWPLPWSTRRARVTATVVGAVVAWFFDSLTSTLMAAGYSTITWSYTW